VHEDALKDLQRLDPAVQKRVVGYLDVLAQETDPRRRAERYVGRLTGFWKIEVGAYRLICTIEGEKEIRLLIVLVAHRSQAYGRRAVGRARHRR
jgi:addiction module RelE/StbE family toxin